MIKRISKSEFLTEFKEEIIEWTKLNEENILSSIQKYCWKHKSHEDSVKERNNLEREIVLSRQKYDGGIDLETADKIFQWGFGKRFPVREQQKVIEITREAFSFVDRGDYYNGIKKLMALKGIGISSASKIIGLSNQNSLAILDSRVGHALRTLKKNSNKIILCPPDRSYKRDYDYTTKNGWAINYERFIWTLEIMVEYFKSKGFSVRMADVEMALFVMGE